MRCRGEKLDENQGEIQWHLKQINKLRGIVLDKAGDQKVSDDEIIQAFLQVGREIQVLAKRPALCVDQVPVLESDGRRYVKHFYGDGKWESWKHKDRELHVHKELSRYYTILSLVRTASELKGIRPGQSRNWDPSRRD